MTRTFPTLPKAPREEKRQRSIDPLTAVAAFCVVALIIWLIRPVGYQPRPEVRRGNSATALRLQAPAIVDGAVLDWNSPEIHRWAHLDPFIHTVSGRVETLGRRLAVRPWIYTAEWLPQPMDLVFPSGEFTALLLFDSNYDGKMAVVLEFEDLDSGDVVASYTYYFKKLSGTAEATDGS